MSISPVTGNSHVQDQLPVSVNESAEIALTQTNREVSSAVPPPAGAANGAGGAPSLDPPRIPMNADALSVMISSLSFKMNELSLEMTSTQIKGNSAERQEQLKNQLDKLQEAADKLKAAQDKKDSWWSEALDWVETAAMLIGGAAAVAATGGAALPFIALSLTLSTVVSHSTTVQNFMAEHAPYAQIAVGAIQIALAVASCSVAKAAGAAVKTAEVGMEAAEATSTFAKMGAQAVKISKQVAPVAQGVGAVTQIGTATRDIFVAYDQYDSATAKAAAKDIQADLLKLQGEFENSSARMKQLVSEALDIMSSAIEILQASSSGTARLNRRMATV